MSTVDNLKAAFAGESQANRKYLAFAEKAEAEGNVAAARLFRAAAEAETIHAHMHLKILGGIKSTAENLQAAIDGETHEYEAMYPGFIGEIQPEETQAKRAFELAAKAEQSHAELYQKVLDGAAAADEEYYLCGICGYIAAGEAPDKCPVCNAPKARFKNIG